MWLRKVEDHLFAVQPSPMQRKEFELTPAPQPDANTPGNPIAAHSHSFDLTQAPTASVICLPAPHRC
jgi:hypothetical protein